MNIGIVIGIILVCLGGVTFWGMLFSNFKFFYKLPATALYLAKSGRKNIAQMFNNQRYTLCFEIDQMSHF